MFEEGFEFETEKGRFVIRDGVPVKAEPKRGPLGGEVKEVSELKEGEEAWIQVVRTDRFNRQTPPDYVEFVGYLGASPVCAYKTIRCETNVPPRSALSGERMTAGEAAQVPGIVGRWVAAKIDKIDLDDADQPLSIAGRNWIDNKAKLILLPEGFGDV